MDLNRAFGTVIGIVTLLLTGLSLYAAKLNPVLARLVHAERRRDDQAIGVGFGDEAASDAARHAQPAQPRSGHDES